MTASCFAPFRDLTISPIFWQKLRTFDLELPVRSFFEELGK
jgi:hypothetical protein